MKKILIVNNNLKVGGVQKSLCNLLWEIEGKYDVTLCLFKKTGTYVNDLPSSVKVIEARGLYRYLGISQGECRDYHRFVRGGLAALTRLFGRRRVLGMIKCRQRDLSEEYDCAIAYLQNGKKNAFYGGVQDFVIDQVCARKKIAFLHCDYSACGADNADNNTLLERFDVIAACSDGCRGAFCSALPSLSQKCVSVCNCHRFDEIRKLADEDPIIYNEEFINVIVVARLSHEKGVERAVEAVFEAINDSVAVKLHIVGDGAMRGEIEALVKQKDISGEVIFYGEQANPYRFMKNADLLLIPSYHEAAPMVIGEAASLGLPVFTTRTTSSDEMVTSDIGWVCDNDQESLSRELKDLLSHRDRLEAIKQKLKQKENNNKTAASQFDAVLSV